MADDLLEKILSPNRDYVPRGTPHHFEEFMKSVVYSDFLNEIHTRIEDMRDFYETCDNKKYLETKGGLTALRMIAGIFTDLHHNSMTVLENKDEEKQNG